MRKTDILAVAWLPVCAVLIGIYALSKLGPDYVYRYRLSVEIATPDGVRSGSGVFEIRTSKHNWGLPETRGIGSAFHGEAIPIHLGQGRNLFVTLLGGPDGRDWNTMLKLPASSFGLEKRSWEESSAALERLTGQRREVPAYLLPNLVTFANVKDSRTAQAVDIAMLQGVLGEGVSFRRAWIDMTKDAITTGIEKTLPAIVEPPRKTSADPGIVWPRSPLAISSAHFKRSI